MLTLISISFFTLCLLIFILKKRFKIFLEKYLRSYWMPAVLFVAAFVVVGAVDVKMVYQYRNSLTVLLDTIKFFFVPYFLLSYFGILAAAFFQFRSQQWKMTVINSVMFLILLPIFLYAIRWCFLTGIN